MSRAPEVIIYWYKGVGELSIWELNKDGNNNKNLCDTTHPVHIALTSVLSLMDGAVEIAGGAKFHMSKAEYEAIVASVGVKDG